MRYTFQVDYENSEFDFAVSTGTDVWDGELEPDLIASLLSQGVLVVEGLVPVPEVIIETIESEDD